MKHYTSTIPLPLAERLKEKGMSMNLWEGAGEYMEQLEDIVEMRDGFYLGTFKNTILYQLPTYADVFDWLMEKGIDAEIHKVIDNDETVKYMGIYWTKFGRFYTIEFSNWHEAANVTIEKVLTLI